jgi:ActR/RegA family two-component response regulator
MSMPRGKKIDRGYATVVEDEGTNYRTIAEEMQRQGHKMNHASARNYILRAMKKFATAFAEAKGEDLSDSELEAIAKSPSFQSGVSELVQRITLEG